MTDETRKKINGHDAVSTATFVASLVLACAFLVRVFGIDGAIAGACIAAMALSFVCHMAAKELREGDKS